MGHFQGASDGKGLGGCQARPAMAATPSEPRQFAPADGTSAPGWSARSAFLLEVLPNLGTARVLVQPPRWGTGAAGTQERASDLIDGALGARDACTVTGERLPGASDPACNGGDRSHRDCRDESGRVHEAHETPAIQEACRPGHDGKLIGRGGTDAGAALRAQGFAGEASSADDGMPPQAASQVPGSAGVSSESRNGVRRASPAEPQLPLQRVSFEQRSSGAFFRFTFANTQLPLPLSSHSSGPSNPSHAHVSLSAGPATRTPLAEDVGDSLLHGVEVNLAFELQLPAWLVPQLDLHQLASSPDLPFLATAEYAQIKLRLLPQGPHDMEEEGGSALVSMEDAVAALEVVKPVHLHCGECGRQVTRPSAALTCFEEMPSLGAVQEMSELWFCSGCCPSSRCGGGGERAHAIMSHLQERLSLQPGKCLVGPTSLVLGRWGVLADQAPPSLEAGDARATCAIHEVGRAGGLDCQRAAEEPRHSADETGRGAEPRQLGKMDNTAQSISTPSMQSNRDPEEQMHRHDHGERTTTVPSTAADTPDSAPVEASQAGQLTCCAGPGGSSARSEAAGQSWTVPDLLPGKEPWREVLCTCGAVLGACCSALRVGARIEGVGPHADGDAQVPQLAALSLESPVEPNRPCRTDLSPLDYVSIQDTMGAASLTCSASTTAEPVHFYSYRTVVHAAGLPRIPRHWLDSQDRLIRAEEAFALQLALLFRPNATFSTRLVVRDVNLQRALLQMSVLTCAGVLDAGLCAPIQSQTSLAGKELQVAARDGHPMDGPGPDGSRRKSASTHSSGSSATTSNWEVDFARAGGARAQGASLEGGGSACGAVLRAVKVLFQDVHPASVLLDEASRASEGWAGKGTEEIYLMESEVQLLREVLVQNSMFYPESVRTFGLSTCSFLRRKVRGSPKV